MMKSQDIDVDEGVQHSVLRTNSIVESDDDNSVVISESTEKDFNKKGLERTNEELLLDIDTSTELLNNLLLDDEESHHSNNVSADESVEDEMMDDPVALRKAQRKAEKKRKKRERRAQREGRGDPSAGQKNCEMCGASVDLLIRCTYDESLQWKMVCGKCWKVASGKLELLIV